MELKEVDFKDYIKVLLKQRFIIMGIFLFIFILVLIYTLLSPKIYSAKTTVIFPASSKPYASIGGLSIPLDIGGSSRGGAGSSIGISSLLGPLVFETPTASQNKLILESRKVKIKLIKKLDLYKVYKTRNTESVLGELGRSTKVWIDKEGLMTILFNSTKPELSAKIANSYIEVLREYHNQSNISVAKRQRKFIEKQLEEKRKELKEIEKKVEDYDEKNEIYDEDMFIQRKLENLGELEKNKFKIQVELRGIEETLKKTKSKYIKNFQASSKDMKKIPASKDTLIGNWRTKLVEKEYELLLAKQSYNPNHIKVRKLETELNQIKDTLKREFLYNIYNLREGISYDLVDKEMRFLEFQSSLMANERALKELNNEISKFPQKVFSYIKLKRELKLKEVLCGMLEQDLETAKIAEAKESPELEVLDEATTESARLISPNLRLNLLIASFMGLVLGIVFAFGWEYLDRILKENASN